MKKILGLDLGTTSIGWAIVNEAETGDEKSSIIRVGVRVNPLTTDEQNNFEKGKSISTNADRTLKRSVRRNLQRYKLRRERLIGILKEAGWIDDETILQEKGPGSTFETLHLRARAAEQPVSSVELARIFLMLNKKRGYKSNRKLKDAEEGQLIDGMAIAKELYENELTPGQYAYALLCKKPYASVPDFYRSDLRNEFDRIWSVQARFYPEILDTSLKEKLEGKNEKQTWVILQEYFKLEGVKRSARGKELVKENFAWRTRALSERLDPEELAVVLQKVNGQIKASSGYLGNISDRSKELYFKHQTVGQYLWEQVRRDPHFSLKRKVFYRQDYLDEFECIWSRQAASNPSLTEDLKKELRDTVIFYQRNLKSQKGLVSICEFEGREVSLDVDGKTKKKRIGPRVCPRSSPLFQEFKIWQILNNLTVNGQPLPLEDREKLFGRLATCDKLGKVEVLKFLYGNQAKGWDLNYREVEGNRTMAAFFKACSAILVQTGHEDIDFSKMTYSEAIEIISEIFGTLGASADFLRFDAALDGQQMERQCAYRLWHLLYSFEGDGSASGDEKLIVKISELTGLEKQYAKILAGVGLSPDYGSLSTRAIRKILPYMRAGNEYSVACAYAGYCHSKQSLTRTELAEKVLKDRLEELPKGELRNPVVEKILNQMVNVVNSVISEYGRPDEVRIELARELKKSAKERQEMTEAIGKADAENEKLRQRLRTEFGIPHPSRNDVIRLKLYDELCANGYHTLYSNTYIRKERLFSKDFDIEHIIPQSRLFDDSFSNKTLEARDVNLRKSNATAFDFVKEAYGESGLQEYEARVENLYKDNRISRAKRNKLLMSGTEIPADFIARDLRDSQYIVKKAKTMLEDVVRSVVPTTGSVTDRLRKDWQLVDVMQELNWEKYDKQGLTETYVDRDGRPVRKIRDWTKRNDHRHHAMDALTIAFTRRSYIQYLNNLNARIPKNAEEDMYLDLSAFDSYDIPYGERSRVVRFIESSQLYRAADGKLRFVPPMPLDEFRREARRQLEGTLVSIKAKNKVTTRNINRTKKNGGEYRKVQLTPRGQLHKETVYGRIERYSTKLEKVGPTFSSEKIGRVASPLYRSALNHRLEQFGGDPKKAFSGKNKLDINPIFVDAAHSRRLPEKVALLDWVETFTTRKEVSPDLDVDKVIDRGIQRILQARLDACGGDPKKAFSNLEENPIWLNKEKGIQIKSVKIKGVNNAVPIHEKRGAKSGPTDYVSTGNNHHVAIFRDASGRLQEQVVPFFEAVARVNMGIPVIDRDYKKEEGWTFLFTMKQNEYFIFPDEENGFSPLDYDLMDPANYAVIGPHLFRVQKLATKNYVFRHHLETNVEENKALRDITWKRIQNPDALVGIVKVRINHIGQIVRIGEY